MLFSVANLGVSLLALSGITGALQLKHPRATPVNKGFNINGWTPKPTTKPKPLAELFRRQEDPSFCGYLEGDPLFPLECDYGYSCLYDDVYSWFGCCTGTSITDCEVYTACVQSRSIDECVSNSACYNDDLAMVCTDDDLAYCGTLYTEISGSTYGHYVCAETDTSFEVLPTYVGDDEYSSLFESFSFLETETTEDFFTDRPSLTLDSSSQSSSSEREESTTTTEAPQTTAQATTEAAAGPPSSVTTAAAARTAEAMVGAAGGLVGMLAFLL